MNVPTVPPPVPVYPGGCEYDWSSPTFHQTENTTSPITSWDWHIRYTG